MNNWPNATITTAGLNLQSQLISGTSLTITRVVAGSGSVDVSQLPAQTAVKNPQQTLTTQSITYPASGKAAMTVSLQNTNVATGYTCMQIGVYAKLGSGTEILYFIAQAEEGTVVPSATEMPGFSALWTFYFQFGNADSVNITVDPSGMVTMSEVQSLLTQALTAYMKLSGGNMTGNIGYSSGSRTGDVIRFIPGDASGICVAIGGNGRTIIGSGESVQELINYLGLKSTPSRAATETVEITSDTDITFYMNMQNGFASSNAINFLRDGTISCNGVNGMQKSISKGTAAPSGGSNGDIYIQYS